MLSAKYGKQDLKEEKPTSSRRKWMTAVVVHMQPIASYLPENPLTDQILEEFADVVQNVIADYGGTTKAVGQDTLAGVFRSAGDSVQDVSQGIQAAFAIMEKLGDRNRQRASQNHFSIRVGIGVHSGPAPPKAPAEHFSPLMQNINKAEGLSILNRQTPFPAIFISKNTLKRLDDGRGYHIQPLGEAAVHDKGDPMPVYAMMYALQPA